MVSPQLIGLKEEISSDTEITSTVARIMHRLSIFSEWLVRKVHYNYVIVVFSPQLIGLKEEKSSETELNNK